MRMMSKGIFPVIQAEVSVGPKRAACWNADCSNLVSEFLSRREAASIQILPAQAGGSNTYLLAEEALMRIIAFLRQNGFKVEDLRSTKLNEGLSTLLPIM
jgi:hypothetical protein